MSSVVEDLSHVGETARSLAMDLEADLDAMLRSFASHLGKGASNSLERFLLRNTVGQSIGPHLDPLRAHIGCKPSVFLGAFDVFSELRGVRRMELEGASQARKGDRRVLKACADLLPLIGAERDFHPVSMGGPQLDRLKLCFSSVLDDGIDIPVFGQVVGHQAELQGRKLALRRLARKGWLCRRGLEPDCRRRDGNGAGCFEETSPRELFLTRIHRHSSFSKFSTLAPVFIGSLTMTSRVPEPKRASICCWRCFAWSSPSTTA